MEFTAKELEDIQRVAGLLNLTADELIQQRRRSAGTSNQTTATRPFHGHHSSSSSAVYISSPVQGESQQSWQHPSQVAQGIELIDLDEFDFPGPSGTVAPATVQGTSAEVILLNPQIAWYDCNASVWAGNAPSEVSYLVDDASLLDADEDYAPTSQATPMQVDSISSSGQTTKDEDQEYDNMDDSATEQWSLVHTPRGSLSSFQTAMSPTGSSAERRYHLIAPKSEKTTSLSMSENSSYRVRKKRSPYQGSKKTDTHLTRQVHACVRCRMQRNRCIPDPDNPRGPCKTCQQRTVRMSRLPCLRYMVTDSTLFRTGLDYMSFYKNHPMIGPLYGDFHLDRQWTATPPTTLCIGQVGAMHLKVELHEFIPPANSADVDLKGRPMYAVPWAIADPEVVVEAINNYIDRSITQYMYAYLDDCDGLIWDIFQAAYRASVFPVPNPMLKKTLRLWVACRFIESKWRCWSDSGRADNPVIAASPRDPFYDWDSLPPYLDYQIASIVIHRILTPLRKEVLRDLQGLFNTHFAKDWFATFLTTFILLQNYEMQMQFQKEFAARRKAPHLYLDMPLVRASNSGAKTILAHFHYCYRGQQLFSKGFNWNSPKVQKMAQLDGEQIGFMTQCRDRAVEKASTFEAINKSDAYYRQYWYTSQLFDSDWTPRDTLEHAPPSEISL